VPAKWRVAIAHFIAAQSCVNALLDIRVLFRPNQIVNGITTNNYSDAHSMADHTFGTTATWAVWFWGAVWLVWSLVVLFVALRLSGSRALANVVPYAPTTASPRGESDRDDRRRSPETARGETGPSGPAGTAGS
jgi:Peptidase M50B-like